MRYWVLLAVVGCSGSSSSTTQGPPAPVVPAPAPAPDAAAAAVVTADASSGVPHLEVSFAAPGAPHLHNTGTAPLKLAINARFDKQQDGAWTRRGPSFELIASCPAAVPPADACLEIPAGGTFDPVPWTGWFGCTQCQICDKNYPAEAGTYRIVFASCDHASETPSASITLTGEGQIEGAPKKR